MTEMAEFIQTAMSDLSEKQSSSSCELLEALKRLEANAAKPLPAAQSAPLLDTQKLHNQIGEILSGIQHLQEELQSSVSTMLVNASAGHDEAAAQRRVQADAERQAAATVQ